MNTKKTHAFGTGLVSVTFRKLAPLEIVNITAKAGLDGIEWGGDIHVPHGSLSTAREVADMTLSYGLSVSSYGSYYKAGNAACCEHRTIIDTAYELGAPAIRIWAGSKGSLEADDNEKKSVYEDSVKFAEAAAKANMKVYFEYHGGTLTDNLESALDLIRNVSHPNAGLYWQTIVQKNEAANISALRQIGSNIGNIHAFHWALDNETKKTTRRLLSEGAAYWEQCLTTYARIIQEDSFNKYVLIEFVKDDNPDLFAKDAEELLRIRRKIEEEREI